MSIHLLFLVSTITVSSTSNPVATSPYPHDPSTGGAASPIEAAYDARASATERSLFVPRLSVQGEVATCDPNFLPPAGVMGAHVHAAGEWMVGYRYTYSRYQGMKDGTENLSSAEVLTQGFAQTPTSMTMQMHEVEAMYGVSDEVSLMASVPYLIQSMPQVDNTNQSFTTHSSGIGDVALAAAYTLKVRETDRAIATVGVSLPTGSIDQRDDMPGCPDCRLEYMMQNGSGTVDLLPALAYIASCGDWAFGAQALGCIRLGTNDNDYRLGDRGELSAWTARRLGESWRSSLRLGGAWWGNVDGADPELDLAMSPTNDPNRQGGTRVDVALGFDWFASRGHHSGSGVGVEFGVPIYQYLDGPQPDAEWFATIGLRFTF